MSLSFGAIACLYWLTIEYYKRGSVLLYDNCRGALPWVFPLPSYFTSRERTAFSYFNFVVLITVTVAIPYLACATSLFRLVQLQSLRALWMGVVGGCGFFLANNELINIWSGTRKVVDNYPPRLFRLLRLTNFGISLVYILLSLFLFLVRIAPQSAAEYRDWVRCLKYPALEKFLFPHIEIEPSSSRDARSFTFFSTDIGTNAGLDISYPNLSFAVMRNISLSNIRLENLDFRYADFTEVDFRDSVLANVNFENAQFQKCLFSGIDAENVSFRRTGLSATHFNHSALKSVYFTGAHLHDASFNWAATDKVTFEGSVIEGSMFFGTCLSNSNFQASYISGTIIWQSGFRHDENEATGGNEFDDAYFDFSTLFSCHGKGSVGLENAMVAHARDRRGSSWGSSEYENGLKYECFNGAKSFVDKGKCDLDSELPVHLRKRAISQFYRELKEGRPWNDFYPSKTLSELPYWNEKVVDLPDTTEDVHRKLSSFLRRRVDLICSEKINEDLTLFFIHRFSEGWPESYPFGDRAVPPSANLRHAFLGTNCWWRILRDRVPKVLMGWDSLSAQLCPKRESNEVKGTKSFNPFSQNR